MYYHGCRRRGECDWPFKRLHQLNRKPPGFAPSTFSTRGERDYRWLTVEMDDRMPDECQRPRWMVIAQLKNRRCSLGYPMT
jgi:hypothetical protein